MILNRSVSKKLSQFDWFKRKEENCCAVNGWFSDSKRVRSEKPEGSLINCCLTKDQLRKFADKKQIKKSIWVPWTRKNHLAH